jgi:hypothetical protein
VDDIFGFHKTGGVMFGLSFGKIIRVANYTCVSGEASGSAAIWIELDANKLNMGRFIYATILTSSANTAKHKLVFICHNLRVTIQSNTCQRFCHHQFW